METKEEARARAAREEARQERAEEKREEDRADLREALRDAKAHPSDPAHPLDKTHPADTHPPVKSHLAAAANAQARREARLLGIALPRGLPKADLLDTDKNWIDQGRLWLDVQLKKYFTPTLGPGPFFYRDADGSWREGTSADRARIEILLAELAEE